jgi:hypothetical protein
MCIPVAACGLYFGAYSEKMNLAIEKLIITNTTMNTTTLLHYACTLIRFKMIIQVPEMGTSDRIPIFR